MREFVEMRKIAFRKFQNNYRKFYFLYVSKSENFVFYMLVRVKILEEK